MGWRRPGTLNSPLRSGSWFPNRPAIVEGVGLLPFVLLLAQTGSKPVELPPSLAAYLKLHPDQAGLAVEPDLRPALRDSTGVGLDRYNRKRVLVGRLPVLVPLEQTVFDDTLSQSPNLYDGLPSEAKVLYLLSVLRPDQVAKASRGELGIRDLQGEPRQVFASLLPKSVKWTRERLGKEANYGDTVAKGELTPEQIRGLRLRVERAMELEIPLANGSNSYTFHGASEENGRPGDTVLIRDTDELYDRKESFGVTIRKTVPNALKRGQLDTSSLNATIVVPPNSTVGDALALAGRATGREILADLRVRDRRLSCPGGKIRSGDLLDGLAYALQATYRRIGGATMLVSDVTGLGARKLRLSLWENDLNRQLDAKKALWRRGLASNGALAAIGYDESSGLAPNEAMLRSGDPSSRPPGESWSSTVDFPPNVRAFLERVNLRYSSQKVDTNRARATWRLRYRFVTADGEPFQMETSDLGMALQFETRDRPARPSGEPDIAKGSLGSPGVGLCVVARSVPDAVAATALARRYGFGELWLDTTRPEVVRAALTTGLPVRLVVRPWSAAPNTDPTLLDRSILGDTNSQAAARVERSEAATRPPEALRAEWRQEPLDKDSSDLVSPFAPDLSSRWTALQSLARIPGLKGVVVLATEPRGYEAGVLNREVGRARRDLVDSIAMGYTEAARLAFARRWSVDPLDLADPDVFFTADLRPPLFLDDALRGSWSVYDGTQNPLPAMEELPKEWTKMLAEVNRRSIESLLAGLKSDAIWVEERRERRIDEKGPWTTLQPWTAGMPLPTFGRRPQNPAAPMTRLIPLPREAEPDATDMIRYSSKSEKFSGAFDLGELPPSAWERRLELWLAPAAQSPKTLSQEPTPGGRE